MLNTIIFPLNILLSFPAKHLLAKKRIFLFGGNRKKNQFCNNCELSVTSLIITNMQPPHSLFFRCPIRSPETYSKMYVYGCSYQLSSKHIEKTRYQKATHRKLQSIAFLKGVTMDWMSGSPSTFVVEHKNVSHNTSNQMITVHSS